MKPSIEGTRKGRALYNENDAAAAFIDVYGFPSEWSFAA